MHFIQWLGSMRELSRFVLTRCLALCCALLASALVMLVWAGGYSVDTALIYEYADHTRTMALLVLGAGILGSALVEDTLEHCT